MRVGLPKDDPINIITLLSKSDDEGGHSMLSLDLMRQSFYEVNFDHQLHFIGNIL